MSKNANFTPLGADKPWLRNSAGETVGFQPINSSSAGTSVPLIPGQQIGVQGEVLARITPLVTGACTKCGFVGHLPFQCRNFIQIKPNQKTDIDVSSTSSEEYTTHLKEEKKRAKKEKKRAKKERKRLEKKIKKELKKKMFKRKRSSSSSSSSIESSSSDDSNHEKGRKRKKEKEKLKKKKDKKRRRHHRSSSSDS